jgi:hypothetical protein
MSAEPEIDSRTLFGFDTVELSMLVGGMLLVIAAVLLD